MGSDRDTTISAFTRERESVEKGKKAQREGKNQLKKETESKLISKREREDSDRARKMCLHCM
jgi:hypothetical protein